MMFLILVLAVSFQIPSATPMEQKFTIELLDIEKFQIIILKLVNFDLHHLQESISDHSDYHIVRSVSGNKRILDTEQLQLQMIITETQLSVPGPENNPPPQKMFHGIL